MADEQTTTGGPSAPDLLHLTAQIVSAHVGGNTVPAEALPGLIQSVYRTLGAVNAPAAAPEPERPQPAVPVKRSVFPDHIVCLEDGQKLKTLKRHLATHHNLTLAQYRERWGLPRDYPTVAPSYAQHRSSLAKASGLGTRREAARAAAPAPAAPRKRGGRARAEAGEG